MPSEAQLLDLIKQIDQLQLPEKDEYELLYLQVDCAIEAALVISMSGNDKAISEITSLMQKLAAKADELDEPWSRDSLLGYLAMMTAHQKGVEAAEAQAKAISMRGYQAEGLGLIASQRARAGDLQGFQRLSSLSLRFLKRSLAEDNALPKDERDWPSWLAWLLAEQWATDAFYSGLLPREAGLAQATQFADLFSQMQLEPGAKAEVLSFLASVIAGYGDHDSAKAWLGKAQAALVLEQKRVNADEGEEFSWSYGIDAARMEFLRTHMALGDLPAAEQELARLESVGMRAGGQAIIGAYLKAAQNNEQAERYLASSASYISKTDSLLASLAKGVAPPDFDEKQFLEDFDEYDAVGFYWDAFYVARDLQLAGDTERLNKLIDQLKFPAIKIGAELGRMRGQYQQGFIPKPAPVLEPVG
ncbi:MAG: hypothetical protein AAF085_09825 [Planctomycetota bacterium]